MGHWCRICDRVRANEKFSGKGHKTHICKDCATRPKDEIEQIDQQNEIIGYLKQSNISAKNVARLKMLGYSSHHDVAKLAAIVLEVARVKPNKKGRLKFLAS